MAVGIGLQDSQDFSIRLGQLLEEAEVIFEGLGGDLNPAGARWHRAIQTSSLTLQWSEPVSHWNCGDSGNFTGLDLVARIPHTSHPQSRLLRPYKYTEREIKYPALLKEAICSL
jgi:hypothetical protein